MISKFDEFFYESRGFPNSLVNLSDFLFDFISKKIDWWVGRKGPSNYSEEFVFWEDDLGFEIDKDFPVKRFKLKLRILSEDSPPKLVSGGASHYRERGSYDPKQRWEDSLTENGKPVPNMMIWIHMDKRKYMDDLVRMKNSLKALIRHELTHLYQFFKVRSREGRTKSAWRNSPISHELGMLDYDDAQTFADLLDIAYYLMTREEFDASLAEVTTGKNGRVDRKKRLIKKYSSIDSKWMIDQIRNEMDEFYPDVKLEEIPKIFLEEYEKDCKKHRVRPLKWALKLRNKSFDNFVLSILDIVRFRGSKWIKKANKIEFRK